MKVYVYKKEYANRKRDLVMKYNNVECVEVKEKFYIVLLSNGSHFFISRDEFMVTIYGY